MISSIILGLVLLGMIVLFVREMRHNLYRSRISGELIKKYRDDYKNPQLIDELYSYIVDDYKLKKLVKRYDITRDDVAKLNKKLMIWGNFHKDRRFVPISAFFYVCTLEYIAKNKDADAKQLTMKCMNYFHM